MKLTKSVLIGLLLAALMTSVVGAADYEKTYEAIETGMTLRSFGNGPGGVLENGNVVVAGELFASGEIRVTMYDSQLDELWHYDYDAGYKAKVTEIYYDEKLIVIGTTDDYIRGFDHEGHLVWERDMEAVGLYRSDSAFAGTILRFDEEHLLISGKTDGEFSVMISLMKDDGSDWQTTSMSFGSGYRSPVVYESLAYIMLKDEAQNETYKTLSLDMKTEVITEDAYNAALNSDEMISFNSHRMYDTDTSLRIQDYPVSFQVDADRTIAFERVEYGSDEVEMMVITDPAADADTDAEVDEVESVVVPIGASVYGLESRTSLISTETSQDRLTVFGLKHSIQYTIEEMDKKDQQILDAGEEWRKGRLIDYYVTVIDDGEEEKTFALETGLKDTGINRLTLIFGDMSISVDEEWMEKNLGDTVVVGVAELGEGYSVSFKKHGQEIDAMESEAAIGIKAVSQNGRTDRIVEHVEGGNKKILGGNYNSMTEMIKVRVDHGGVFSLEEAVVEFDDLKIYDEYERHSIESLASKGIINGRTEGIFDPNGAITRAEFAKLIIKVLYLEDDTAVNIFSDVNDSDWFSPYVAACKEAGIINGYADNTFKPNEVITKQEVIKIIGAALTERMGYLYPSNVDSYMARYDDEVPEWVQKDVALLRRESILFEWPNNIFNGEASMTRRSAVLMLHRLFDRMD